jgi:membrane-bound serine protease (ClpP class)
LAATSLIGAIVLSFMAGVQWGVMMLGITVLMVPAVLALAVKVWPHTPLGRKMLIQLPQRREDIMPDSTGLRVLLGRRGVAKSKMLPSGAILIDGRTYDAVSVGVPIDEGQTVEVTSIQMNRIVVRPYDGPVEDLSYSSRDPAHDPRLDEPLDKFGLEPLDDPLS